ncbi:hypothetical protein [Pelosinus sp. sgz500959]|uniref:hypothetical protein n=1 Tax=Pelosinus sp. sgz500959 TaxID=3242472 RepID=UPI00367280B8
MKIKITIMAPFPGIVYECEKAGELLGVSIQQLLIEDEIESMYEVIKKAIEMGTTVILGELVLLVLRLNSV